MPDLVDSDDEEDEEDEFVDNEVELQDLDLPRDDSLPRDAVPRDDSLPRDDFPRDGSFPQDDELFQDDMVNAEPELGGGDTPQPSPPTSPHVSTNIQGTSPQQFTAGRENVEKQLRKSVTVQTFVEHYPDSKAGDAVPNRSKQPNSHTAYGSKFQNSETNPYAPFSSHIDWKVAKWAKLRGPSSTAFSELLAIDGLQERLALSYKNTRELNKIIDEDLPGTLPRFRCKSTPVLGESVDLYYRPILECIQALLGNVEFANKLLFSPERHYSDKDCTIRVYHDMHTGKWWWDTQVCVFSIL